MKRLSPAEKEKIEDLTANGLTPNRIAGRLQRSHHTIANYIAAPDAQEAIAGKLQDIVLKTVDAVSDEDVGKAGLVAKLTAVGIAIDKIRLIRGQPTQIDVHLLLDAVSAIKELRRRSQSQLIESEPAETGEGAFEEKSSDTDL